MEKIKSKKFKVVIDAINSAGSEIIPQLLMKLNCEVIKINCNSTGIFTRGPEPIPENLNQLSNKVIGNMPKSPIQESEKKLNVVHLQCR